MPKNPLVGTPVVDKKRVEELILWEPEQRYCRTAVDLPAGTYEVGEVIANESVAAASGARDLEPSFSDVICLENIVIPDGETREVAVFVRGPALLNMDAIKRASDSESDTDLKTRLADFQTQLVRFTREPAVQSTPDLAG